MRQFNYQVLAETKNNNSLLLIGGIALAALMATMSILIGPKGIILFLAVFSPLIILSLSTYTLTYGMVIIAFLIVGPIGYFFGLKAIYWIPYLLCAGIGVRVLFERVIRRHTRVKSHYLDNPPPFFFLLLSAFFFSVLFSASVNNIPMPFWLIALKNYVVFWFIAILLWNAESFEHKWLSLWRLLLFVSIVQFPMALLQRYMAVGATAFNWDAVVGTFGGDPEGGGFSGAMMLFLIYSMALATTLWRHRQIQVGYFSLVVVLGVVVIGIAEVKAALFLLPLAAMFVFRDVLRARPFVFLAGAVPIALVIFGLIFAYYQMYVAKDGVDRGFIETLAPRFSYILDTQSINRVTGEVGRLPALIIWWDKNASDLQSLLFGHGPMAVRFSSTFGVGPVLKNYGINIGMYSLPVLLWELGVMSVCVLALMMLSAIRTGMRLATSKTIPVEHRAGLDASALAVILIGILLPYNRDVIDSPAIQVLFALSVGHIGYWWRHQYQFSERHS